MITSPPSLPSLPPLPPVQRLRRKVGASAAIALVLLASPVAAGAKINDRRDGPPVQVAPVAVATAASRADRPPPAALVSSTSTNTTTVGPSTTALPFDLRLCRTKLQLLAQLDRQRAKVLTLLARADTRYRKAIRAGDVALAAAMNDEVESNEERLVSANADIAQVLDRCR